MDLPGTFSNHHGMTGQSPVRSSNERVSYHDPAEIQAWAAISALGGPFGHGRIPDGQNATLPSEVPWTTMVSQVPGYLSHSTSSHFSDASRTSSMQQVNGSLVNEIPGESQSGTGASLPAPQDYGFEVPLSVEGDHFTMDYEFSMGQQPYPSPIEDDMCFTVTNNGNACTPEDDANAMNICHGWNRSANSQELHSGLMDNTYQEWADANVDPSALSSHSSQHPDTPLSMPQDSWVDDSLALHPPLMHAQTLSVTHSEPYFDGQRFELNSDHSSCLSDIGISTLRPMPGSQRTSLPESWTQPQPDIAGQVYGSPVSTFTSSRRSSDGEPLSARRDRLYKLKPREDGYYQCIYVEEGKQCDHEAFKLKCNYDKHLDSHLKPYRCKQSGCAENPFSSTACLLRHEREAHGMHNHKEVRCEFRDCERSFPGRGFPRKWNAHDHMKRVHRYVPPEDSNSPDSPPSSMDIPYHQGSTLPAGRRRVPTPVDAAGAKKTKHTTTKSSTKGAKTNAGANKPQRSNRQTWTDQDARVERTYQEDPLTWPHWQNPAHQIHFLGGL